MNYRSAVHAWLILAVLALEACTTPGSLGRTPAHSAHGDGFTVEPWVTKYVATADRPFTMYNWVKREALGLPPQGALNGSDPKLAHYLETYTAYRQQNLEAGLFLGTDPVYYRGYGEQSFLLTRLHIPVKFRFLDLFSHYDQEGYNAIPAEARQAMADHGCTWKDPDTDWESVFRGDGFDGKTDPKCIEIVSNTLAALGIQGIKYRKGADDFSGCAPGRPQFAVILTDTSWVKPGDEAFFYKEMDVPALRYEQVGIEKLFLEAKPEPDPDDPSGVAVGIHTIMETRPWPELDPVARAAPDDLLHKEILGCF